MAAVAVLALLAVPAGVAAQLPAELRIGVPRLPETLDPAAASGPATVMIARLLFQGLVSVGERGDIEPALASRWSVTRDGLTWTFWLRRELQFHNGTPLTPESVVAALSRHLAPEEVGSVPPPPPGGRVFRGSSAIVREIRRGPGGTVQIQLNEPFSPLLALLAHPALAIRVTESGSELPFLGTGPYRVAERRPGRLALEAVTAPGEAPRTPRIVFEEFPDDAGALAELNPEGRLDIVFPRTAPAWATLGLQVLSAPAWRLGLLAFRTHQGLFARKSLRQAADLALDRGLIGPALGRSSRLHGSLLPPGAWAGRDVPLPPFDPARARRMVAEAHATGARVTLLAPEATEGGPDLPRVAEAIRLSLAVVGLDVQVRLQPRDAYLAALQQGDGEMAFHEVTLEVNDPHFALYPLVASEGAVPGTATNVAFYRNPLVDSLLLRGSQLAFRPERLRLYQRLQVQLAEDLPYLPLSVGLQWAVTRPGVQDLRLDPTGAHRLERVRVQGPEGPVPLAGASPSAAPAPPAGPSP